MTLKKLIYEKIEQYLELLLAGSNIDNNNYNELTNKIYKEYYNIVFKKNTDTMILNEHYYCLDVNENCDLLFEIAQKHSLKLFNK